ncbi:MAG TPA: HNH endonuclease [Alphaproteobacteria bacterium]|nr:HNH endonuclease [Alphaproteobacteria bacterium]
MLDVHDAPCWLCGRPLGRRAEWHHPRPKSRGGRDRVAVHPICHRAIHANFTNTELARLPPEPGALAAHPAIERFLKWIAGKPPDFHAPTRGGR